MLHRPLTLILVSFIFSISSISNLPGQTNFPQNGIIISEFFEELLEVPTGSTFANDVLDSPINNSPFGQILTVIDSNQAIVSDFADLYLYNRASQSASLFATLPDVPSDIALAPSNQLIATTASEIITIDLLSGAVTTAFTGTFFAPEDVVATADGSIFITEFFDALSEIDLTSGTSRRIGNFSTNQFEHLDLGPDGFLYTATTFNNEFFRINPNTGQSTLLGTANLATIEELKVADDGSILFGGSFGGTDGIFEVDPLNGNISTVFDGDTFDDDFFDVLDFDLTGRSLRIATAIPEPSSTNLLALACIAGLLKRKRRRKAF